MQGSLLGILFSEHAGDKNKPSEKEQECREMIAGVQLLFDRADPADKKR